MKRLILIVLLFLAVIFQTAVFPNVSFMGIFPNLLLIVVISFCLCGSYVEACIWSVFGGLMLDISSVKSFGLSAISLLAAAAVIYLMSFSIQFDRTYSKLISAGMASLTYYVVLIIFSALFDLMKISHNLLSINWRMIWIVLISIVINAGFIFFMSPLVRTFNQWLIRVDRKTETKYL